MNLHRVQRESRKWRRHNFSDNTIEQQLMGMMEELGEIAHHVLKHHQAIREYHTRGGQGHIIDELEDGLGDLIIYTCGFADHFGIDLQLAVSRTWEKVQQRDWIANPVDGSRRQS